MKKKEQFRCQAKKSIFKKTCLLFVMWSGLLIGNLRAQSVIADNPNVTLQLSNVTLIEFFNKLTEVTGKNFVYSADILEQKGRVSVAVENERLEKVLDRCLKEKGLEYTFQDDVVLIYLQNEKVSQGEKVKKRLVRGVVRDQQGEPLVGATVVLKNTHMGVATDVNGRFEMEITPETEYLVFSFIGKKEKEVSVKKHKELEVVLEDLMENLEDVVITGYGNISKSSFTGNSVSIKREDLLKVSKSNVIAALQTFDPSFRIQENNQWGSDPNAIPEMYIRGRSGVGIKELDKDQLSKSQLENNPNLPLFIMDGFEISARKLYDFDPNRIENVTILKDAAATAMYGSRAANGVVVITTIAPKPNKIMITYNMTGTVMMPDLSDYNLMNAREKLEAEVASGVYQGSNAFGQDLLNREYHAKLSNVLRGVDTDWLSQPLRTAFNHQHSLYLESGAENLRFGVELNYNNNDGVMKGSFRDRAGVGLSVDYRIGDFQIRNYFSYTSVKSKESPYGIFSDYTKKLPYDEMKDEYGQWLWETTTWHDNTGNTTVNPLYEAGLKSFDKTEQEEFVDNLNVNWYVTPHLQLKGQVSVIKTGSEHEKFIDPKSRHNTRPLSNSNVSSGELHTTSGDELSWNANVFAAYNYFLNEHNINLNVGFNIRTSNTESLNAFYRGFPSGILHSPNYAQEIVTKPTANQNKTRLFGVVGTLNYSYRNIWLLDVAFRSDGSSEFGSDRKFAPFWSGGVGINFHNFAFMQQTGWVNTFRLKGSYGVTGKVNFAPYSAQTIYQIQNDEWYKTGYGATLMALGNMSLGWEKTRKLNIGADLELWKGVLQLSASWYKDKTVDLINDVTIPASSGFRTYVDNVGEVVNKGVEINLRGRVYQSRDWMVNVFANLAHNKNEILKVAESLKAYNERVNEYFRENMYNSTSLEPFTQYVEGGSLTSIYAMRSLGIDPATGEELLLTKKGDITTVWNTNEQVIVGNKEPKAQGTLGFNVSFKGFSLYATFLYEFGGQRYNSTLAEKVENVDVYNYNVDKRVLTKRWQKPGDHTKFKALQKSALYSLKTNPTERFVQDYNVLSLNSLTLGYDFKSEMVKKWGLGVLRFEVGANDLFRLSSVKAERGLSYPYARNINFSFSVSL